MILLIDNYDSFSYNLVQLIGSIAKEEIKVVRNDEMSVEEVEKLSPEYIILSPGPGKPEDAGICEDVVRKMQGKCKILGVCLGHQGICEVYGAKITYAKELMHGKQSLTAIDTKESIFKGLPEQIPVARYHSLAAQPDSMPDCLKVIGKTEDGEIMAVRHKEYEIYGLQFHPESVLTPDGEKILKNFLNTDE
ncbi:MAG: aminodeoxychorismate/anthranilate synthase component II [Lachnospiraceae bacterium]|nr:aminodeoxychorismate/anthranilate synthase component II [Lachnospiraceae bacterium]